MAANNREMRAIAAYGDFQTPPDLARAAVRVLSDMDVWPDVVLEPTCGRGSFVAAAATTFPDATRIIGIDINLAHLDAAQAACPPEALRSGRVELRSGEFFRFDWHALVKQNPGRWLILGNPPWVTSAGLGSIESSNHPAKTNFHGRAGIEAITGKSNFDISEWMILRYLDWLQGSAGTIAVLCKAAVARKILLHIWTQKYPIASARLHRIDAIVHFGAAVEACFFVIATDPRGGAAVCDIYDSLTASQPARKIGFSNGRLIQDMPTFQLRRSLFGPEDRYIWRSGIKHDCAKIMELTPSGGRYVNGLGETVDLEDEFLFPLLKSSDIGNGRSQHRAVMLVTQRLIGQETDSIRNRAPLTWQYLRAHTEYFGRRGSRIYKGRPDFSIFGVGPYSFSPWKVAISGFYKQLSFRCIGSVGTRPIVLDDTVSFLPCWSEDEARFLEGLLNSGAAREFYGSMIHWDEKRPITIDLLRSLSLRQLAAECDRLEDYLRFAGASPLAGTGAADLRSAKLRPKARQTELGFTIDRLPGLA